MIKILRYVKSIPKQPNKYLINAGYIHSSLDDVIVQMLAKQLIGDIFYIDISSKIQQEPIKIVDVRLGDCIVDCNRGNDRVIGFEVECCYELNKSHIANLLHLIRNKLS